MLVVLYVDNMTISGTIPSVFGALTSLVYLSMGKLCAFILPIQSGLLSFVCVRYIPHHLSICVF